MNTENRLLKYLADAGKKYPNAWKQADAYRAKRHTWPNWCFMPLGYWYSIVTAEPGVKHTKMSLFSDLYDLATLGAWRVTKGIYRFDPDLYEAVSSTPVVGEMPCEILYHMPEWCVYIETPKLKSNGFFAYLEYDVYTREHKLRIVLDTGDELTATAIPLGKWTLMEALQGLMNTAKEHAEQMKNKITPEIAASMQNVVYRQMEPKISLLLYLCSESADFGGLLAPKKPKPTKTKKGLRFFPPDRPRTWDVGVRIGAALRSAQNTQKETSNEGTGHSSPRAHIRRAHWHTYRTGKNRENTKLNWLPPIPVKIESFDKMPMVIKNI